MPAIKKTADVVQEVAAASQEQSAGVDQINKAVAQVDQVTQRNASAAEELASTAEEMASQAESLQQLIGFFRVADEQEAPGPQALAPHLHPLARPAAALAPAQALRSGKPNGQADMDGEFRRF